MKPVNAFYAAVWRWHLYCGLLALPVLAWLAVTGSLYLFHAELERALWPTQFAPAQVSMLPTLPPSKLADIAGRAAGARPVEFQPPAGSGPAQVVVRSSGGEVRTVFLDPGSGAVRGIWEGPRLGQQLRGLHSLSALGGFANRITEAAACLALVMVATGIYLWWPRAGRSGLLITTDRGRRRLWRDVHALSGVFTAGLLLFMALSALPWTPVAGARLSDFARDRGLGMPLYVWDGVPQSSTPTSSALAASWTLKGSPTPRSAPAAGSQTGLDGIAGWAARQDLSPGYFIRLPEGPDDVFSVLSFPKDRTRQRVIHIDQYSGEPLVDVGFPDYGAVAQAVEWGVGTHTGEQYGEPNRWLILAGSLAILVVALSALPMWWLRRPPGSLPPLPRGRLTGFLGLGAGLAGLAVALPLLAAAVAAILILDLAGLALSRRARS